MTASEIMKKCEDKGLRCSIIGEKAFFYTGRGEWFVDIHDGPTVKLFHKNNIRYTRSDKFCNSYHVQGLFPGYDSLIKYIIKHDTYLYKKKNKKKTGVELAFERIENKRKMGIYV